MKSFNAMKTYFTLFFLMAYLHFIFLNNLAKKANKTNGKGFSSFIFLEGNIEFDFQPKSWPTLIVNGRQSLGLTSLN